MPDPTDNPKLRRIAAALGYDPSKTDAPKLMAKGQGDIADKIIELAKEHNIPIREDRALVAVLAKLDLDQEIPPELYHTIAELLAFVYRANKLYKNSK